MFADLINVSGQSSGSLSTADLTFTVACTYFAAFSKLVIVQSASLIGPRLTLNASEQ